MIFKKSFFYVLCLLALVSVKPLNAQDPFDRYPNNAPRLILKNVWEICSFSKETFERFEKVEELEVHHSRLSRIPDAVTHLPSLTCLDLSYSDIYSLPAAFFQMTNLREIRLDQNKLKGPLDKRFSNFKNLKLLWMEGNGITGDVSPIIASLPRLKNLDLRKNRIRGNFFEGIKHLKDLTLLNVSHNLLEGPIPESFTQLHTLKHVYLEHNAFSGPLPDMSDLAQLEHINISSNKALTGVMTVNGYALSTVDMYGTKVEGFVMHHVRPKGVWGIFPPLSLLFVPGRLLKNPYYPLYLDANQFQSVNDFARIYLREGRFTLGTPKYDFSTHPLSELGINKPTHISFKNGLVKIKDVLTLEARAGLLEALRKGRLIQEKGIAEHVNRIPQNDTRGETFHESARQAGGFRLYHNLV